MPEAKTHDDAETRAKFQILIRGSIQDVWHEITRTDRPIPAFFNTQMHTLGLAPGARLAMRTKDAKWTGVVGEVLAIEPPRHFAHTFKFTNFDDPECRVLYDLEEVEGGTQFTMTITDLPVGTKTAKQMVQGGTMIVNTLKSCIETGKPSFGTRMLFGLFKVMAPFSPKQSKSEYWPLEGPWGPDGAVRPG